MNAAAIEVPTTPDGQAHVSDDASGISLHPEFFQMLERASKYVASLDEEEIQSKEPEKSLQNPIG